MIGTRFIKPLEADVLTRMVTHTIEVEGRIEEIQQAETFANPSGNTLRKYAEAVQWCIANGADMVDCGKFYEVQAIPAPSPEELAAKALEQAKAERAAAVAALTVEVDGMVFDGDEKAQERMARAVSMADSLDEETEWVLHDSTVAIVTAAQLRRACRAAGKAQTALWVKPYQS